MSVNLVLNNGYKSQNRMSFFFSCVSLLSVCSIPLVKDKIKTRIG